MVEGSAGGYDISLEVWCSRFYATVVAMVTTPLCGVHIPSFTNLLSKYSEHIIVIIPVIITMAVLR